MTATLLHLAAIFSQLSLLAFGGGNTILPEMQRQVVDLQHWMSAQQFSAMFALAQAAPGPNMMVVTLIGWHVAGWPGVLVTTLAKFGPSSILTGIVAHLWQHFKERPWRHIVQKGLQPMTVGLVAASAFLITDASAHTWSLVLIATCSALITFKSKIHPLWVLAGGALLGWSGVGQ